MTVCQAPIWPAPYDVPLAPVISSASPLVQVDPRAIVVQTDSMSVSGHDSDDVPATTTTPPPRPRGDRSAKESKKLGDLAPYFALPLLATQSGGLILSSSKDIVKDIGSCIEGSSLFYSLSFNPPNAGHVDEYHGIKIEIGRPGVKVRTNTGYYNEPVFYNQPRVAAKSVTAHELEAVLDVGLGANDGDLTKQLQGLELTERLSSGTLSLWLNRLHGKKARSALTALADESVFLGPPANQTISEAPPDQAAQEAMMAKTATYVDDIVSQLPGFTALRTMVQYEQPTAKVTDTWNAALADQSLREGVTELTTLRNIDGHEQQDKARVRGEQGSGARSLNFIGIFGSILRTVLGDATESGDKLSWVHWERGSASGLKQDDHGKVAVYGYQVSGENPRYTVTDCCLRGGGLFRTPSAYHGEISIDPETGAIVRLTMEAEPGWIIEPNPRPVEPVKETDMMVEYGPVEIGGRSFICPLRSVVTVRRRTVRAIYFWGQTFSVYGPYATQLEDVAYTHYRKFGSESRILPGFEVVPEAGPVGGAVTPPQQ
jgi:hypothetical protein